MNLDQAEMRREIKERLYTTNKFNITYQESGARLEQKHVDWLETEYDIRTDVHRMCINCQARQVIKYLERPVNDENNPLDPKKFNVNCDFVAKGLPPGSRQRVEELAAANDIELRDAMRLVKAAVDPVAWTELMFGFDDSDPDWHLRPYQKEQLRCTARKNVVREGRRCVVAGTKVLMGDGSYKYIEDISAGDLVVAEHDDQQIISDVYQLFDNGEQEVYEVKLQGGATVEITSNHPLYARTRNHWREDFSKPSYVTIDQGLKPGHVVAMSLGCDQWGELHDPDLAAFLGYMITDGSCTKSQTPKFTNNNLSYVSEVEAFVRSRFPDRDPKWYPKGNGGDLVFVAKEGRKPNPVRLLMKSLELDGKKADAKHLRFASKFDKQSTAVLLNRMWAGDGSVSYRDKGRRENDWSVDVALTTASYELAKDLQMLLYKIGVYGKVEAQVRNGSVYWKYRIQEMCSARRFLEFTGDIYGKEVQSQAVLEICKNSSEHLVREDNWRWQRVLSIEPVGVKQTYDIEVGKAHSFISNGIVSHNSGKTFIMALKMLYYAFNLRLRVGSDPETGKPIYKGPSIMIITPFQAQVANIFREMEELLKRNESGDLMNEVTTQKGGSCYVKTPFHRLEFSNGARINGFVSGVGVSQDGSGGGVMRGQNANIIYLDEMDMIPEDVLNNVIIPIVLTRKNAIIIATSTPIGKRGAFYNWCLKAMDFKEDYLPSTVLPTWDENEAFILDQNTEESFRAEYMAEFIDGNYGVFKASLVYAARKDYSYRDTHIHSSFWRNVGVRDFVGMPKIIGIDWNKNAGTEFVVVGFDDQGRAFVLEAVNVPHSEFSSVAWGEEVRRLNFKWKPDYIYADQGYGHTIIEDLKLVAHSLRGKRKKTPEEVETVKLSDRLVAFDFKRKVKLRNPSDGRTIEKEGKHFLVENAVRVLEAGRFWFPESDKTLLDQLLNYRVLRWHATTNKPVYGPDSVKIGDHRLDALMLALGGFALEFSMYSRTAMPTGAPSLVQARQDRSGEGYSYGPDEAAGIIDSYAKAGSGMAPSVLALVRAGENEPMGHREADHIVKMKYAAQSGKLGTTAEYAGRRHIAKEERKQGNIFRKIWNQARGKAGYETDEEMFYTGNEPGVAVRRRQRGMSRRSIRRRE